MAVLLELPLGEGPDGTSVLVEADHNEIAGGLTLAAAEPGKAVAKATESLTESLERLEPLLRTVKDTLVAAAPEHFSVEFDLKFGGETELIIAKGTAEVNMTITMSCGPV